MLTIDLLTLDQAMAGPFDHPRQAVTQALQAHRWDMAHLVVVRAVPAAQRRAFLEGVVEAMGTTDPLAVRMVAVLQGKELVERAKESWTVSPMAHAGYFAALRPSYARFTALMAVGDGPWSWAQRRDWLNEALMQGLAVQDQDLGRAMAMEAVRCPHAEVWDWLHAKGLLAPHGSVLLTQLRERLNPALAQVERLLGRATARPGAVLLDHDHTGAHDFQDLVWGYGAA